MDEAKDPYELQYKKFWASNLEQNLDAACQRQIQVFIKEFGMEADISNFLIERFEVKHFDQPNLIIVDDESNSSPIKTPESLLGEKEFFKLLLLAEIFNLLS